MMCVIRGRDSHQRRITTSHERDSEKKKGYKKQPPTVARSPAKAQQYICYQAIRDLKFDQVAIKQRRASSFVASSCKVAVAGKTNCRIPAKKLKYRRYVEQIYQRDE